MCGPCTLLIHTPILLSASLSQKYKQLIPPDMKFDPNSNPPCFNNPEEQVSIERNARVRLKIVGTRVDATEIVSEDTCHAYTHDHLLNSPSSCGLQFAIGKASFWMA
jgi:hypothetical protein